MFEIFQVENFFIIIVFKVRLSCLFKSGSKQIRCIGKVYLVSNKRALKCGTWDERWNFWTNISSPLGIKFLFLSTLHDTVQYVKNILYIDARFEPGTAAIHCANILLAIDNTKCDRMYSWIYCKCIRDLVKEGKTR